MPIDLGLISLVGGAVKLSWSIYEKGFSKDKSSPQRYIEFGDALHRLHSNLNTIETIVTAANKSLEKESIGSFGPSSYDLSSLTEIIGNFRLTLDQCRDLLDDETKFRQRGGFITNVLYNINVDPQVVHLTERLTFHNTKVGLVLDPFNIHVQTQLGNLHREHHQDVSERLQELKQLLISSQDPNTDTPDLRIERDLRVPCELDSKFEAELQKRTEGSGIAMSVKDGLEIFFGHFNETSRVADSMSYLRLMKSIWIMDRIQDSDDYRKMQRTNSGGLYDRCVREMDRRLRAGCSRVAESRMPRPQLSMVLQLPDDAFLIWPKTPSDSDVSQTSPCEVLLDVPVLPELKSHTLRVVRNIDGTLGIEDTTIATSPSSGNYSSDRVVQKLNIDLRKAYLVPIYAMPSNTEHDQPSLTMKVQSSRDGINGIVPEFKAMADLYSLQHLITGYRCILQRKGVKVKSLTRGQEYPNIASKGRRWSRKSSTDLLEVGNLQFWQKSAFETSVTSNNSGDYGRRMSGGSSSTYPASSLSLSASSILSTMSSAHTQQISLGSSRTAIELKQPEPARLVLFLKQRDTGQLSFLMVELDERTKVEANSCDCRSSKKTCSISVLERSERPLLAQRYYAKGGLNSWNLAVLGEYWSAADSDAVKVRDMYWLRLGFKTEEERIKFNKNIADLVRIFTARMEDYRKDLKLVRGTQILTQVA